jgi:hypothetical protein
MNMSRVSILPALAFAVAALATALPSKAHAVEQKTFLINGLASAVPFIGYGFTNLQKKIPGAELYSYLSPIEGTTIIQPKIMSEIRAAVKRNPDVEINLIGISYGANMITWMSADLADEGIQISYMGVIDGLPLGNVPPNVRRVDNFTCRLPGCLRDKVRLTKGNNITIANAFDFTSTHIDMGNNPVVHQRILHQITTVPLNVAEPSLDMGYTASTE